MQPPTAQRFGSPYAIKQESDTSFASDTDTHVAATSDYNESPDRYFKQKKSSHGKVAYVVYTGNEVGVFYNWTAASHAISGLEDENKIYKGYSSYHEAHGAWEEFVSTGRLPGDVALSLGSKPYPVPPILPAPPGPHPLVPPTTPQRVRAYNPHSASPIPSQTLFTPRSGHAAATPSSTSTGNRLNTPIVLPSTPSTPTLPQSRSAAALAIVLEEALRADNEDFWVVFTGITPGVHQGREAGERAFGPFENPSFVRTSTRENANQIFVDGYMKLLVVRYGI